MAGDRSPTAERRRGIRRLLLARGEPGSSSSSPPPPPMMALSPPPPEEGRRKGFASAALRGLGCTSAAASQAYAPGSAAAAAVRSSADWHGRRRRRTGSKERRKERRSGGGGGGLVTGGIGADVWCAPGIPFAAEASSVDCVVARHQMVARGRAGAEGERSQSHREVSPWLVSPVVLTWPFWSTSRSRPVQEHGFPCSWLLASGEQLIFSFPYYYSQCWKTNRRTKFFSTSATFLTCSRQR